MPATDSLAHFTIAYWCVLAAALLPFVCAVIAKSGRFDNHDPRGSLARLQGWRARANAAQSNCFESLPFFIGAVVIAHQLGAPQGRVDALAAAFVVLRLAYLACYLGDKAAWRSGVWFLGLLANIAILFAGYC
jgi:uncharacterized MAPEG superfamily protein